MDREKVLSVENISKTFPGVKALNNISLDLYSNLSHLAGCPADAGDAGI